MVAEVIQALDVSDCAGQQILRSLEFPCVERRDVSDDVPAIWGRESFGQVRPGSVFGGRRDYVAQPDS
jgi:hypothetical protein